MELVPNKAQDSKKPSKPNDLEVPSVATATKPACKRDICSEHLYSYGDGAVEQRNECLVKSSNMLRAPRKFVLKKEEETMGSNSRRGRRNYVAVDNEVDEVLLDGYPALGFAYVLLRRSASCDPVQVSAERNNIQNWS